MTTNGERSGKKKKGETATSARMAMALRYAEHELPVVPLHGTRDGRCTCGKDDCALPGLHPRKDIADATTDSKTIRKYWTKWPKAPIGLETGKFGMNVIAVMITENKADPSPTDERVHAWDEWGQGNEKIHTVTFSQGDRHVFLFLGGYSY
jgi:hypothetical protein